MSSAPTAFEIAADARWLAQALDPGAGLVRLVEMSPEAYRAASFLDDRLLQQPVSAHLLQWEQVRSALPPDARSDARWIFHISHVGSTLVSRLLGELGGVLSLREPRSVYDLTFFPREVRNRFVPDLRKLLSRTFARNQIALVKATSFASEIAAELAGTQPTLFLYLKPRRFIEAMLAGENSRASLRTLAPQRLVRMRDRVGTIEGETSDAELAAIAWACEMTALERSAQEMDPRGLLWMDFDLMLEDMEAALTHSAGFLGFNAPADTVRTLVGGPLMRSYSKAPEYRFTPEVRRQLLDQAGAEHRSDIDRALAMLASAAENSPLLQRALERANSES